MRRTALVTGASRGFGAALATGLAARGWHLILDARTTTELSRVAADLGRQTNVTAIPGDVTDPAHRRQLAQAAKEHSGLDALILNAGTLGPSPRPPLLDYSLHDLRQVYEVNVVAPLALIQALSRQLRPGAAIAAITSDAATGGYAGWGGYGSSKAALEALVQVLGAEHPQLRVYRVDPGDMRTRMQQDAFPGEDTSDRPPPAVSVPGLVTLLEGDAPTGRYAARAVSHGEQVA